MKNKILIIFITLLVLCLTSCSINTGQNNSGEQSQPEQMLPDNLGGGGNSENTDEVGGDVTELPEAEDKDPVISVTPDPQETIILDTISATTLTIQKEGVYCLTGTFNGNIVVKGAAENITIILDNVNIATLDSQSDPAILFEKHSGTRIINIKEGTTNTLKDSVGNTILADNGNAIIQAKKSNLDITGSGTLKLISLGEETTAIKVKKDLTITDTTIEIDVNDNAIKAGSYLSITNADIDIVCGNDGIKTDVEAESAEEGDELTKDQFAGYLTIKNSNIKIVSGDDGISANSYLKIDNTSSHTIEIKTNNGAPNTITETSSDNANGKAIRTSGITLVVDDVETDLLSQTEDNYLLVILGGKFIINSNDDAITSKGNLIIDNGDFNISSGDDGIHAEYVTVINNGNIIINKCYEGLEGAAVEIYNGNIDITSTDDGINAANSDLTNYSYNIFIGGGQILVNAEGDGIDSNGTVEIKGGSLTIWGPTRNDNAALDADRGILLNGGNVVACGPMGMVETPATNSLQPFVVYNYQTGFKVGDEIIITDSNNNIIYQSTVQKAFSSIVFSSESFTLNATYTIKIGSTTETITLTTIKNQIGNTFGPGGSVNPGRPGGGGRPR